MNGEKVVMTIDNGNPFPVAHFFREVLILVVIYVTIHFIV